MNPRIGIGVDVHRFGGDRVLHLAGLQWPGEPGLEDLAVALGEDVQQRRRGRSQDRVSIARVHEGPGEGAKQGGATGQAERKQKAWSLSLRMLPRPIWSLWCSW